jgi:hypothetical protein
LDQINPLIHREFEVVTAKQGAFAFIARTLIDSQNPNDPIFQVSIRHDGTVADVIVVNEPFADINENYSHGLLYATDEGGYSFKESPYRPSSYPSQPVEVEVYYHNDGKVWAIATKRDLVFFANSQTGHFLVCQNIDNSTLKSKRVADKIGKGYFLLNKQTYNPATNSFI